MKITLPIARQSGYWSFIDAEIVDVAPHLAHIGTFAVGPNVDSNFPRWRIHNVETGGHVEKCDGRTKNESIQLAKKKLAAIAPEFLRARMKRFPKLAP